MLRSFASKVKQFLTAVSLLLLAALTAEFALQLQNPPASLTIAATVPIRFQNWLAPSATMHHELLRLNEPSNLNGPTIAINSFGLRGAEPKRQRTAGALRILLLGDETILGPELENQYTVAARLQEFLSKTSGKSVEVINAGVPGYCPLLCWLQYQHELQQLQPDVVVLHFDMSDIKDDSTYRKHLKKSGTEQICINANLMSASVPQNVAARIMRQSALLRLLQEESGLIPTQNLDSSAAPGHRFEWTFGTQSDLRLTVQHAVAPLSEFKAAAEHGDFRLLVSCSPVPWQVTDTSAFPHLTDNSQSSVNGRDTENLPFQILKAVCAESEITFCSSVEAFRSFKTPAELFTDDSVSLSPYGAALYAREIATVLLKEQQFANLFSGPSGISANPPARN
jgi:hypothetical protein